ESLMERRVRHTLRPGTVRIGVLARDQASEGGESKRPFKLLPFHTNACDQLADAGSDLGDVDIPRPVRATCSNRRDCLWTTVARHQLHLSATLCLVDRL